MGRINTDKKIRENLFNPCHPWLNIMSENSIVIRNS